MINKVFSNAAWLVVAEIVNKAFSLVLTILVARHYGVHLYGQFIFALTFVSLFQFLADFGLGTLTIRNLSRNKNKAYEFISSIISLRIVFSLFAFFAVLLVSFFSSPPTVPKELIYLAGFNLVFVSLAATFTSVFIAFEKTRLNTITKSIQGFTLLIFGGAFIFFNFSITHIMTAYIFSNAILFLTAGILVWNKISKFSLIKFNIHWVKPIILEAWPFGVITFFSAIYYSIDSVMLGYFGFTKEVGWYGAVYRIIILLFVLRATVYNALYPQISQNIARNKDKLLKLVKEVQKLSVVLSVPLGVGTVILAPRIMSLIFGPEYLPATIALQILIWSVVLSSLNLIQPIVVSANNQQKLSMIIMVSGALLNVALNFILIPMFTITGAAIATVVTNVSNIILITYFSNKIIRTTEFLRFLPVPILGSLIMGVALYYLYHLHLILLIMIGVVVYLSTIYLLGFYKKEEVLAIKELILKRVSR